MVPDTSCLLDLADQIVSITQLLDKSLEEEYEKATVQPIVFTNKDEFEQFSNKYFIGNSMKDFEYQKYDLLFINVKKVTPQENTLYRVNSISKLRNTVEIILKTYGKVTDKEMGKDNVIENVLYVRLSKEKISLKSNFVINK